MFPGGRPAGMDTSARIYPIVDIRAPGIVDSKDVSISYLFLVFLL